MHNPFNGSAGSPQSLDAQLTDVAGLSPTDNGVIIGNGTNFVVESGATLKTSLGLTIGTDVQAYDAELAALAGLTSAADKVPYFTGSGTAAVADFPSAARSHLAAMSGLTLAPPIRSIDVAVSSAELLALNATPKQLIPAPGATSFIMFIGAIIFLDYNSAAYAGIAAGEDLAIRYTDGSGNTVATVEATGFLDQTADHYRFAPHYAPLANNLTNSNLNAPLVLHMTAGEVTTGNSPIGVRVFYRVIDVSTLLAA